MHGAAADHFQNVVAELLHLQRALHQFRIVARDQERVIEAEKVRRMQHRRVQHVALNPLAAIDQAAEIAERAGDGDTERVLHRLRGAHHVGDGADAADARGNIGGLAEHASAQQRLEKARRLDDAEFDVLDLAALDPNVERALALDPGERIDLDGACGGVTHWLHSWASLSLRNGSAAAVKPRNRSRTWRGPWPSSAPNHCARLCAFGVSFGPKQA